MPEPGAGESEKDFIKRCIPIVLQDGTAQDSKQAAAVCFSLFKKGGKSEATEPEPPAVKIGARNNSADAKRLQELHDALKKAHDLAVENGATCNCGEHEAEPEKEVESIDAAGSKSAEPEPEAPPAKPIPLFNYVSKLHLPYQEQFLADIVAVKRADSHDAIKGYTMLWGDPNLTDVEVEFFLPETNFWDKELEGFKRPLTFDHMQDKETASEDPVIGSIAEYGNDRWGRWYVAQLKKNLAYRDYLDKLISQRKLGTSSDSASQYVVRKSAGKAVWLAQWPWFASALTPTPAEPRMLDVGLPYWKSAGVSFDSFARTGAPEGAIEIPEALRIKARLVRKKAGVL